MTKKTIIFDGDMGGDDLWAMAILNSFIKKNKIDLLGMTTCFGNTNLQQATRNTLDFMDYIGMDAAIPIFAGADRPISGLDPLLDGAYGANGLSNATLPTSKRQANAKDAVSWMADTLSNAKTPITIMCTGPITNIATVYQNYPELDGMGHEIIWLGGALCLTGGGHKPVMASNGDYKRGNITEYAEFNAINDPVAAQIIADLKTTKVTIIPLDAGQHMDVDVTRATAMMRAMAGFETQAVNLLSMLDDSAKLDQSKFGARGGFAFDPQVPTWWAHPELFLPAVPVKDVKFKNDHQAAKDFDAVASGFNFSLLGRHGQMTATECDTSNITVIPGLASFGNPQDITNDQITAMDDMAERRWSALMKELVAVWKQK